MKNIFLFLITLVFSVTISAQNSDESLKEVYSGYTIQYKKSAKNFEFKALIDSNGVAKNILFFIKLPNDNKYKNSHSILVYSEAERKSTYFYPTEINKSSNLDTISLWTKTLIDKNFKPEKDFILSDQSNTVLIKQAKDRITNLINKKYKEFALSTHPFRMKSKTYTEFGVELENIFNSSPINLKYLKGNPTITSKIVNHNGQLECLMKWNFDIIADKQNQKLTWNILATSIDNGANWFFTEFSNKQDLAGMSDTKFIKLNQILISPLTLENFDTLKK